MARVARHLDDPGAGADIDRWSPPQVGTACCRLVHRPGAGPGWKSFDQARVLSNFLARQT